MANHKQKQTIGRANKKGDVIGEIERWEAHKKGVLHRAFTLAILYRDNYILQHRKHPVFDGVFDITSSSHQLMSNGKLEDTLGSARKCFFREWKINESDIFGDFKHKGAIYYRARDAKSIYTEHEICDLVEIRIKKLPEPNYEVAYGYSLVTKGGLANKKGRVYQSLAPWVKKMIEEELI